MAEPGAQVAAVVAAPARPAPDLTDPAVVAEMVSVAKERPPLWVKTQTLPESRGWLKTLKLARPRYNVSLTV